MPRGQGSQALSREPNPALKAATKREYKGESLALISQANTISWAAIGSVAVCGDRPADRGGIGGEGVLGRPTVYVWITKAMAAFDDASASLSRRISRPAMNSNAADSTATPAVTVV
jgi:hypothetical protein